MTFYAVAGFALGVLLLVVREFLLVLFDEGSETTAAGLVRHQSPIDNRGAAAEPANPQRSL